MPLCLLIIDPDGRAKKWPIRTGTLRLGRGKTNDLIIVGRGVSRNHALLTVEDGSVRIEDQDSTYGTQVNGRQVRTSPLSVGDNVDIGVFRLVLLPATEEVQSTGRQRRPDSQAHSSAGSRPGTARFEEVTTGVMTTGELTPMGNPRSGQPRVTRSDPSLSHVFPLVRDSQLQVKFVRSRTDPAIQAFTPHEDPVAPPYRQMVSRMEHLARSLSHGHPEGRRPESSDLASLLLVFRAAELMSEVADLSEYLDAVLDLLVSRLDVATAVLVRRTEIGQLKAVAVKHQDPLRQGEIPVSRAVVDRALETRGPVLSSNLRADPSFGHRDSVMAYQSGALLAMPLLLARKPVGVLYLSRAAGSSFDHAETETVAGISSLLAKALSLREMESKALELGQRNKILERFHAPEALEVIFEPRQTLTEVRRFQATILHVDVAGFDGLIERLKWRDLHDTVVGFRSLMYEAVFGNGGTIVWMRECSAMVLFGGQSTAESDAAWALSAAMEMVREVRSLAAQADLRSEIDIRVGLDRGPVSLGLLGPNDRLLFSALGTPVVRARQLCGMDPPGYIHTTDRVLEQIPNPRGRVERLDPTPMGFSVLRITP